MAGKYRLLVMCLSVVSQACRGILSSLSRNEFGKYEYSTGLLTISIESIKLVYAFCWMKLEGRNDKEYRKSVSLKTILLLAIPPILNSISGNIYYILQELLDDELTIHSFSAFQIVTAAILSYMFLHRKLALVHWVALVLLCTSVISIEFRFCPQCRFRDVPFIPMTLGLLSACAQGASGVITEWLLKEHKDLHLPQQTIWIYFWSASLCFLRINIFNLFDVTQLFTFSNWNRYAVMLLCTEVVRGLSTSYILKKTDSLTDSFLFCFSLIIASIFISFFFTQNIPYPYIHRK